VVELLLAAGADPNLPVDGGATALHAAAATGSLSTVLALLQVHPFFWTSSALCRSRLWRAHAVALDTELSDAAANGVPQAGADASAADETGARAVEAGAEVGPEAREVVETLLPLTQPPAGAVWHGPSCLAGWHSMNSAACTHVGAPPLGQRLAVPGVQGGPASGAPSR
jgi:Ankyrin repeats (many copies)